MASAKDSTAGGTQAPIVSHDAVFKPSAPVPEGVPKVDGPEFNDYVNRNVDITVAQLVADGANAGFQSTAVAEAARIVSDMVWRCTSLTFSKFCF